MGYGETKPADVHYVASVTVQKVTKVTTSTPGTTGRKETVEREVADVARIVVSDLGLSNLRAKVKAHIDLVDSNGTQDIDESKG